MIVRWFWRECPFRNKKWRPDSIDSFWVEATLEEAEQAVFPLLPPEAIGESRELAERGEKVAQPMGNPARAYSFLVARDSSAIDPFPVNYPIHQLWNAYSPFEMMPERKIGNLDELAAICLPPRESA